MLKKLSCFIVCLVLAVCMVSSAKALLGYETWATDPTGSYPVAITTSRSVLIGTTLGCSFEHGYEGRETLLEMFHAAISDEPFPITNPKVAIYGTYNEGDYSGMVWAMDELGIIDYQITNISLDPPLDVSFDDISMYDVIVLDAAPTQGEFPVLPQSLDTLTKFIYEGGKVVGSAYIFVYWYDYYNWLRESCNWELKTLFGCAMADPMVFTDRGICHGNVVLTLNAAEPWLSTPVDPFFHFFHRLVPGIDTFEEAVAELVSIIEGMEMHSGIENSMLTKLNAASSAFERGQVNTAVNILNAFINEVEAQKGKKLTDVKADILLDAAYFILALADGTSLAPAKGHRIYPEGKSSTSWSKIKAK